MKWIKRVKKLFSTNKRIELPAEKILKKEKVSIQKLTAKTGGVSVGVAQDGTEITVYNLNVSEGVIKHLLHKVDLPPHQVEKTVFELFNFIEKLYRYLPLKGMGRTSELNLRFSLIDLFIPLNARLTVPKNDTLEENIRLAGRQVSDEDMAHMGGAMDSAKPILNLIEQYPVLVILGDPGSGKSTVVRFLSYLLVTGQADNLGFQGYLPLLLPLANYSEKLVQQPDLSLREFAQQYYRSLVDMEGLDSVIEAKLASGKVLILLDGLDEVRVIQQRGIVVERVQRFLCKHICKGNRVVMTSRIIGYQEVRPPEVEGLRECTLLDFDDREIDEFIKRWTTVIEKHAYGVAGQVANYEAAREANELIEAVRGKSVRRLAANPLLLTMLVKEKRQGVTLPRHRVILYERYIVSLMDDWLLARTQYDTQHDLPSARLLRKTLEPLAWWLQVTEPGKGLVNEEKLLEWLRKFYRANDNPDESARTFIHEVREYSGLLLDRGGRKYGFLHLTFMEYLAGVHLANQFQQADGIQKIVDQISTYANQADWSEVLLLAIGYMGLNQNYDQVTTDILQQLLDREVESNQTENAVIVSSALGDMGEEGVTPEGWNVLRKQLLQRYVINTRVAAKQRTQIGRLLALSADPREEIVNLDAMQFCYVPKGYFFMGSCDEDGAGEYQVEHDYYLARFTISVSQFKQYLMESAVSLKDERCIKDADNKPVVYISWNEAVAFCQWLTKRWRQKGYLPKGYSVRLPSETEWEMAAKGGSRIPANLSASVVSIQELTSRMKSVLVTDHKINTQRDYPWGNDVDNKKVNYGMHIGSVSSLGCYPSGASPYGCEDMSGNVLEWSRSGYQKYPYPNENEREDLLALESEKASLSRVLRGGAFSLNQGLVRCAARFNLVPTAVSTMLDFVLFCPHYSDL